MASRRRWKDLEKSSVVLRSGVAENATDLIESVLVGLIGAERNFRLGSEEKMKHNVLKEGKGKFCNALNAK